MTEIGFVIEIDLRNHGNFRDYHGRSVEPATHSDLIHREFDAGLGERVESDRGETFEECRMRGECAGSHRGFDDLANTVERCGEFAVADRIAVDANALVDALKVRRGV